ncbi:MAG: MBL fold metallo-hydrolase, partial [Deltaproteobacteria bacterium]|nr:MBL fold metallo-hydrolase [Deltaproteobacteria bacterium]
MIEKIVEGVQWIPGRDKFLPDSHMYVVGKPDSADFSLVDCGLMEMGGYKLEELENCGVRLEQVTRIIMTHTHMDHIGCLPEILEAIPDAEVWVHRDEALYLESGDERIVYGNKMFESMIRSQYNVPKDFFRTTVHRHLEGGEVLDLGGVQFKVIHLPGHSAGSIGLFNERHRLFMSGDTIYADGAIGRFDLFSANPVELKQSLELIADLGIEILLPCHNRIVKTGADP